MGIDGQGWMDSRGCFCVGFCESVKDSWTSWTAGKRRKIRRFARDLGADQPSYFGLVIQPVLFPKSKSGQVHSEIGHRELLYRSSQCSPAVPLASSYRMSPRVTKIMVLRTHEITTPRGVVMCWFVLLPFRTTQAVWHAGAASQRRFQPLRPLPLCRLQRVRIPIASNSVCL